MTSFFQLEYDETLVLLLFKYVTNVETIKTKLSNSIHPFSNCTIVNYQYIIDPFQILVAANKAVVSRNTGTMITKSLSTELLFNLSISENITVSLNKFGFFSNNEHLLLAVFEKDPKIIEAIISEVQGNLEPIDSLSKLNDVENVKLSYDITEEHLSASSLLNLIVTKIACKGL